MVHSALLRLLLTANGFSKSSLSFETTMTTIKCLFGSSTPAFVRRCVLFKYRLTTSICASGVIEAFSEVLSINQSSAAAIFQFSKGVTNQNEFSLHL